METNGQPDIASAARLLARGAPLAALRLIALRDEPPALALRGVAMAQLGEHDSARALLRRAARSFGPREPLGRARCELAEAEVELAARELHGGRSLDATLRTLEALGDRANVLHARLVAARRALLLGRLAEAGHALAAIDPEGAPPRLVALAELTRAEHALRLVHAREAVRALERAREAALVAGVAALVAEIEQTGRELTLPAARLVREGEERALRLGEVEALFESSATIVDACRRGVRGPGAAVSLATRPVLLALARALAEAWPGGAARERLAARIFEARAPNDSHRARLRVEIGRLRAALRGVARIEATRDGYALAPLGAGPALVLAPPVEGPAGSILALLSGGEPWATAALAAALGTSRRTVQRALRELEASGRAQSLGRGRMRRWTWRGLAAFATPLLLPTSPSEA